MSDKSLFAILLRSSWWISLLIALGVVLMARFLVPDAYFVHAAAIALPFVVIGALAAWKQLQVPGAGKVAATVDAVTAMSWRDFSALMEKAFQREGYSVTRINGPADFKIIKAGRVTLVGCKRWKAASHGLEPLRDLNGQREAESGHDALYVALGNVTENARHFARTHKIQLVQAVELTALLRLGKG